MSKGLRTQQCEEQEKSSLEKRKILDPLKGVSQLQSRSIISILLTLVSYIKVKDYEIVRFKLEEPYQNIQEQNHI